VRRELKIVRTTQALTRLKRISDEIRYAPLAEGRGFTAGLISFRPKRGADAKQIKHRDRDVLCHVVKGRGRLRVNKREVALAPGTFCHIPKGTPHDFAAGKKSELVLFYCLIQTR